MYDTLFFLSFNEISYLSKKKKEKLDTDEIYRLIRSDSHLGELVFNEVMHTVVILPLGSVCNVSGTDYLEVLNKKIDYVSC